VPALALALALAVTSAAPPTYVALGDSTGVGVGARRGGGYPARLVARATKDGRAVRLVNLCASGARVADVVAEQVERALTSSPAVVTLGIGINDVTRGTDVDAFAADYERVAAALAGTGARVVVVNVPDLSLSPLAADEATRRGVRERVLAVNARIAAAARRHGFELVDLHDATEAELARDPGLLAEDRFHPSDRGYDRWTELVAPAFERALGQARRGGAGLSTGSSLR
jgi:lysophospholipase L1-like esterase